MAAQRLSVEVWSGSDLLGGEVRLGVLHATPSRGNQIFSFEYDADWLDVRTIATSLDPNLPYVRGEQYVPDHRDNFGAFLDSAPDRWGRVLMQRREAQLARETKRPQRTLAELDYLLGVFDGHRMGALRFRFPGGPYLDDNTDLASPPWTSLRELEQISLRLEDDDAERDPHYGAWLKMLVSPGRSLGGARPKASVVDPSGRLWLAKFPSKSDPHDIGGWEGVLHVLAARAGITLPEARTQRFGSKHHTFLARRFDRADRSGRIHFASAMTLIDRRDGEEGASYLDLAQILITQGARAAQDLEQLWRRIVFFVCVSNVDDHLRNHAFLLDRAGWVLAPAYDMNPVATGNGLILNISESDNAQDLDLVREVAQSFRVKPKRADQIVEEVVKAVRTWRAEAKRLKLSKAEQDRLAPAFRLAV